MSILPLILYYSGYVSERLLPVMMWLPSKLTDANYWYYFTVQTIINFHSILRGYAQDILFFISNLYAAHQFNILYYRIKKLSNIKIDNLKKKKQYQNRLKLDFEKKLLSNASLHYQMIYL